MSEGMNVVREIARITGWANEMTERPGRGEMVPKSELVDYKRTKVVLLAEIARRHPSAEAETVLEAARAHLAELESREHVEPGDLEMEG